MNKKILLVSSRDKATRIRKLLDENGKFFENSFDVSFFRRKYWFLRCIPHDYSIFYDIGKKGLDPEEKNFLYDLYLKENASRLENRDFCIIADDCWGAFTYKFLGLRYNTPLMWTFIGDNEKFIKMCCDLKGYLKQPLELSRNSQNIIVGHLGDVLIDFSHYNVEEDVLEKWNKRLSRMNGDNIFIKMTCRNKALREEFGKIPFKNKILFTEDPLPSPLLPYEISPPPFSKEDYIGFWQYVHSESFKFFDVIRWLNTGEIKRV